MDRKNSGLLAAGCCLLLISGPALSLEKMSDDQLSDIQARGANWTFENIEFRGEEGPNGAKAGSIGSVGTDGSALTLERFQFSAGSIGTRTAPLTTGSVVSTGVDEVGERNYLRIGFPDRTAWDNVDLSFDALYGNPTELDAGNRNILVGGTPSDNLQFGHVSLDNIRLAGYLEIAEIPTGYTVENSISDGGLLGGIIGEPSRQGMLLNVAIDELSVEQILFEPNQGGDGIFNSNSDLVLTDFSITNLNMKSATIETRPTGWRFAYSDPLPFTGGLGETLTPGVSGHPEGEVPAERIATVSFGSQMTHGLPNTSRIEGFTVDHLVFNVRND